MRGGWEYRMAGNIGGELSLVIWRSSAELPNLKVPNYEPIHDLHCINRYLLVMWICSCAFLADHYPLLSGTSVKPCNRV